MEPTTIERKPKPWLCPNPECRHQLGLVVFGQLYADGVQFNTSDADIVIKCPKCSTRKTWYASDRLSQVINEIAEAVARRLRN